MNKGELDLYRELNAKFMADTERVARILEGLGNRDCYGNRPNYICYADTFKIEGEYIHWNGAESTACGFKEHDGKFPLEYLTMTDDELKEIVRKENKERR